MSFLSPEYFWLLLFLLAAFMKKDLHSLRLTSFGYIATFVLLVVALARPVIEQEPIKTREYLSDVVLGVDLSYSMQARDITPSRLEFAKEALKEITTTEQKSRFGVIGFTTNAIVLSPLTGDSELLLHLFGALDEKLIMTKGSSVMPALELARKMSNAKSVSVVLLSDGADEADYSKEAAFAKEHKMVVNVLMIGTKIGTTLMLENGELLKDEHDTIVVTRENSAIKILADVSGGAYTQDVDEIVAALVSQRDEQHQSETLLVQNRELFYYFIGLAIVLFLVSVTRLKRRVLTFLLLFGVALDADVLNALRDPNAMAFKQGVTLYKSGEYEAALSAFETVKSSNAAVKSVVFYNVANTLVRLKEFEKARVAFEKSLTLGYSKEADENLRFIKDVQEQKDMSTGQQKSAKNSSIAKERENSQKLKEGGGSNMKVSAPSGSGSQDEGKKTRSQSQVNLNSGKAKLSSKQYELINKRQINEAKPY
jgi:Ca-activated chloride channel family protein